jgi:Spy/CpxP family protein refolding chaperone
MELNGKERREHSNAVTSFNRDRDEKDDIEKEKNNKYNSNRRHKTLFSEERFETNAVLLPSQKRKVVQWRMKDRVNISI